MSEQDVSHVDAIRILTEQALAKAWASSVRLHGNQALDGSERSNVYRFNVAEGPSNAPSSVIVKRAATSNNEVYNTDDNYFPAPAWRFFNEWAGLQFLSQFMNETPVAPRFYAADRAHGLIVLEDLGQGQGLGAPLLGSNASKAEAALVQIAELLGRMHSRTVGKRAEFDRLRDGLAPRQKEAAYETYEWLSNGIREAARALEVPLVHGTEHDLSTVITTIRDPGPFLAYTHGDPCPDNFLKTHDQIKLIDYEFGDFRHALTDGVYGRIHFPTCWCVNHIPPLIVERMEVAYRTALAEGCPAARNDMLFERAVVIGCAYWACTMFDWYRVPTLLDSPIQWGTATVQQRVLLRADIFANLTMQRGYLQALGATVGELAVKLRAQLPREAHTMPFYPPFRS